MMKRFVYAKIAGFLTWPIFSAEVNNFGQSRLTERPVWILINQFRWANSEKKRERERTRENGRASACLATDREMQNNNKIKWEKEREKERDRVFHSALPTIWNMEFTECDARVQSISLFLALFLFLSLSLFLTLLCVMLSNCQHRDRE